MKKWNHLMPIVTIASIGMSASAQTHKPSTGVELTENAALLSSPRYREEHPELLRGRAPREETPAREAQRFTGKQQTDNAALLSSPRYLEDHPELLRRVANVEATPAREAQRLAALTKNAALVNSPRFREEHPELLLTGLSEGPPQFNQY
jgi:hypothetical protein